MKITMLTLLFALLFTTGMAQCDIGTTGIAVRNANNTASVSGGCVGQIFNFRFTVANFGSSPSCVMPAGTVKVTLDFPTISGGIKPYIYHGPASFNTGFFTWFYDSFFEQLKGVNTTAIGFGQGDADILVEIIGNAAGTASSPLNLFPGPNTNNTNNDFASAQLIINAQPTVTWANTLTNQCANSTSYTLTGGSPSGGTYSGPGVTGNNFNAVTAGTGPHTLTYTFTNGSGCTATANNTITVFALPVVSAGSYGPVCSNAAPVALGGSPSGGTWSGTGVTGNNFNPSAGTQTLTYNYTDANGCSNSSNTTITVNTAPVVTAGSYGPVCSNAGPVALGGSPSGGTWSGTGVTGNSFNPSAGTQTLTYTYSNGTCSNTSTTTITVNTAPVVTAGSYGPVCSNAGPVSLGGTPSGGTWSGTGVTGNSFNPAAGTQTLTYTYSDGTCSNSSNTTITVNTAPVVTTGSYGPVCSNASSVALGGTPSGGTWSGTGVTGNSFNPAAGTQTLTYTYSDGTCSNSSSTTITVNPAPNVSFTGLAANYCTTDAAVTLTGTPPGGTFSGPGISGNSFDPGTAGAGVFNIVYSFTNGSGCTSTSSQQVTVTVCPTTITLNLKLFIQGYYLGGGIMQPVLNNQGVPLSGANETDTITVELHHPTTHALIDTKKVVLLTDGMASATFTQPAGLYYIAIRHRSTIQTWTTDPVSCSVNTPLYDFTLADTQAFGNNMAQVETGVWAFYTGDINQDDFIDGNDYPDFDLDIFNGVSQEYRATDLNGDGFVDGNDYPLFDLNIFNGVTAAQP